MIGTCPIPGSLANVTIAAGPLLNNGESTAHIMDTMTPINDN
jgi:hypothetical protein